MFSECWWLNAEPCKCVQTLSTHVLQQYGRATPTLFFFSLKKLHLFPVLNALICILTNDLYELCILNSLHIYDFSLIDNRHLSRYTIVLQWDFNLFPPQLVILSTLHTCFLWEKVSLGSLHTKIKSWFLVPLCYRKINMKYICVYIYMLVSLCVYVYMCLCTCWGPSPRPCEFLTKYLITQLDL